MLCLQPLAQRAAGHRCLQKRRPRARHATLGPPAGADREAEQANQCVPENCRAFWEQETPATLSCALCPRVPGRISLSLPLSVSLSPLLPSLSPSLLFSPLLSSPLLSLSLSSPLISSPFLLLYLSLASSLTHSSLSSPLSLSLSTLISHLSLRSFLSLCLSPPSSLYLSPSLSLSLFLTRT